MTLYEKIVALYPELDIETSDCFDSGVVILENAGDGRGDYIAKWKHPTLARPTQEQLDAVGGA